MSYGLDEYNCFHIDVPISSETQRTRAQEKYCKRKEIETREERDQRNKKRREKYKEQVLHAKSLYL